ncbi:MAG: Holliday junction branch migration protein RuvA [Janthinobacterium lividum]
MIAHLRGQLLSSRPNQAVIECAGVGYDVAISVATYSALPAVGKEAKLYIYTKVAEDQLALFGFVDPQEKALFEKLLLITGIGPKLAITVLSGVAADRLITAIRSGDHATLVKIPGIGKKTAERIVLELKDKLDNLASEPVASVPSHGPAADDALSALINLGYPRPIAQKALEAALKRDPSVGTTFETLFRAAMAAIR